MKKEIMNLVKADEGTFVLNNVSYLRRWTRDVLDNKVDKLEIHFRTINNVCFNDCIHEIEARDYDGIIEECAKATEAYFAEVQRKLISNMRNGYH